MPPYSELGKKDKAEFDAEISNLKNLCNVGKISLKEYYQKKEEIEKRFFGEKTEKPKSNFQPEEELSYLEKMRDTGAISEEENKKRKAEIGGAN